MIVPEGEDRADELRGDGDAGDRAREGEPRGAARRLCPLRLRALDRHRRSPLHGPGRAGRGARGAPEGGGTARRRHRVRPDQRQEREHERHRRRPARLRGRGIRRFRSARGVRGAERWFRPSSHRDRGAACLVGTVDADGAPALRVPVAVHLAYQEHRRSGAERDIAGAELPGDLREAISAAYGVVVVIFQWGWGAQLIGLPGPVPIESYVPMMLFAVLFGLSMDYELFLLSRIKEQHEAGLGTTESVAIGLQRSGRIITAAALVLAFSFVAFISSGVTIMKMLGLGIAFAILLDATIVRALLVPALMRLLGDLNWWAPRWMKRIYKRIGLDH